MSGYKNFAVVGAATPEGQGCRIVNDVVVLTREASKAVEGNAKVVQVDYSNEESIKNALTGVDVVISTVSATALMSRRDRGVFGAKANMQSQLKALGMPYAAFYTGPFSDFVWVPFVGLDVTSGKVSVGGDGNKQITFTARPDVARYISYVLTRLPAEQLKNRRFTISGDNKSFNEIFKAYEEKTGKKLEITYIPVSELDARLAANPQDLVAYLHRLYAVQGPFKRTDNYLYPDWNPSPVIDNLPVA
ncbi:hypothetical protein BJV77DRAFT_1138914 [Russula vinacea]|nr:hypothetical protein BJV77DRAFT_1138914 [Russula vinacea]